MITLRLPKNIGTVDIALVTVGDNGVAKYFTLKPSGIYFTMCTKSQTGGEYKIITRGNTLPLKNWRGIIPQDYFEVTLKNKQGNISQVDYGKDMMCVIPRANITVNSDDCDYIITIDE